MSDPMSLVNLAQEFIAPGRPNRPGTKIKPRYVTIHNTSNTKPSANAAMHSRFVRETGYYIKEGKKIRVSWHFSVDDTRAIQHLPVGEMAFHAGDAANLQSVAVEICMHKGIDQAAADERAAALVAVVLRDLNLGTDALRTHKSWTGKPCPTLLLARWEEFVQQVEQSRASLPLGPAVFGASGSQKSTAVGRDVPQGEAMAMAPDSTDIDHELLADALEREPGDLSEGSPGPPY